MLHSYDCRFVMSAGSLKHCFAVLFVVSLTTLTVFLSRFIAEPAFISTAPVATASQRAPIHLTVNFIDEVNVNRSIGQSERIGPTYELQSGSTQSTTSLVRSTSVTLSHTSNNVHAGTGSLGGQSSNFTPGTPNPVLLGKGSKVTDTGLPSTLPNAQQSRVNHFHFSTVVKPKALHLDTLPFQNTPQIQTPLDTPIPNIHNVDMEHVKSLSGHPVCGKVGENPYQRDKSWDTFALALESYRQFHKDKMEILNSGSREAAAKVRTLTWSCQDPYICSGIADQYYRIEIILLLAMMSQRVLTLHWNPLNSKAMKYVEPNEIDWSFFARDLGMQTGPTVQKFNKNSYQHYEHFAQILFSQADLHITMNNRLPVPFSKTYSSCARIGALRKGFQQLGVVDILKRHTGPARKETASFFSGIILRYLFKFSQEALSEMAKLKTMLGLLEQPYLAIHLRTGFAGTSFEETGNPYKIHKNTASWMASLKCSLKLAEEKLGPNAPVYLATDSYVAKRMAVSEFGHRIKAVNMALQHLRITNSHDKALDSTDGLVDFTGDRFMATWVDFLLLARARIIVRGDSGFSASAGYYCSFPFSRVYSLNCQSYMKPHH